MEAFGCQVDVAIGEDSAVEAVVLVAVEEAVEHCLETIPERILPPIRETARLAVADSSYWEEVVFAVDVIVDQ